MMSLQASLSHLQDFHKSPTSFALAVALAVQNYIMINLLDTVWSVSM
jgi:isopropylmalate/homocitrate/citramalate synthase